MSAAATATTEMFTSPEDAVKERLSKANAIVRKNMYWAMGLGVVPVPLVDVIGVAGFQAKALKELSTLYDIPFFQHSVKNILAMLVSGFGSVGIGIPLTKALAGSVMKSVPILGQIVTVTTVPMVAGALTYAVGKVFVQHFESGGTFLTFNPKKVHAYFKEQFAEGMKVATGAEEAKATAK